MKSVLSEIYMPGMRKLFVTHCSKKGTTYHSRMAMLRLKLDLGFT